MVAIKAILLKYKRKEDTTSGLFIEGGYFASLNLIVALVKARVFKGLETASLDLKSQAVQTSGVLV